MENEIKIEKGFVYFIKGQGSCKIGASRDVDARLECITNAHPEPLEIIHTIECEDMFFLEDVIQNRFSGKCVKGEWFNLDQKDIEEIKLLDEQGVMDKLLNVVFDFFVQRRTDRYVSANVFIRYCNSRDSNRGVSINQYKINKATKEFVEILKGEGIRNPMLSSHKGTWMHPKMFIDFAMWAGGNELKSQIIDGAKVLWEQSRQKQLIETANALKL